MNDDTPYRSYLLLSSSLRRTPGRALAWLCLAGTLLLVPALSASAATGQSPQQPTELRARELMPLKAWKRPFKFLAGDAKGKKAALALQPSDKAKHEWVLKFYSYNRIFFHKADDGSLLVDRIELQNKDKAVDYNPGVPLLLGHMRPGLAAETDSTAVISKLSTGKVTHRGTVEHRVGKVTRSRFDIPAGKVTGYLVEINQKINLDLATVTIRLQTGYAPGHGVIYRRWVWTLEKVGMFGNTTTRTAAAMRYKH